MHTGTNYKGKKLKERMQTLPVYGVSFGSETECSVASASMFFLNWP
jgi:hypothetical protein